MGIFTIPNSASAGFPAQAEPDSIDFAILLAGFGRVGPTGVQSGCAVTASTGMNVSVAAGVVRILGRKVAVVSGTVTCTAAHATLNRFDLVVVNTSAVKSVVAGTAAASPVFPAIPANSVVLAAVYIPAADTTITDNQITGKGVTIADPGYENVLWYGADSSGATDSSPAFTAAIAAIPDTFPPAYEGRGGTVIVPPGRYRLNTFVSIEKEGLVIQGMGGTGSYESNNQGYGSSLFTGTAGMVMLGTTTASGVWQGGPVLRDLNLRDNAGGSTLVQLYRTNRAVFEHIWFRGSATGSGTGLYIDGFETDASWWRVEHCHFDALNYGIRTKEGVYNGRINGGEMNGVTNGVSIEGGVNGEFTSDVRIDGVKFDGGTVGIFLRGTNNYATDCSFENVPTAIILDGIPVATYNGPINHVVDRIWIASLTNTHKGVQINLDGRECVIGSLCAARGNQITFANMIIDNSSPNGTKIMGPVSVSGLATGDYSMFLRNFFDNEDLIRLRRKTNGYTGKFMVAQNETGGDVWSVDAAGGQVIGGGTKIAKVLSATATWDPGSLGNAAAEIGPAITVTGAAVGDPVFVGHSSINGGGWVITGVVSAVNTVTPRIQNNTGGTVNLGSGTVRVVVFQF